MANFIEVKLSGHVVYLTPEEIGTLLKNDIELYKAGIQRGKAFSRANTLKSRINAKKGL